MNFTIKQYRGSGRRIPAAGFIEAVAGADITASTAAAPLTPNAMTALPSSPRDLPTAAAPLTPNAMTALPSSPRDLPTAAAPLTAAVSD